MNTDKKIQELYMDVFNEVHASDELLGKVKAMTETKKTKNIHAFVKVLYIAAAAAVLLVASNLIAYAATGETLLRVFVNGEEQTVTMTEEDGVYTYTLDTGDEDETVEVYLEGDFSDGDVLDIEIKDDILPELTTEEGRTYLTYDEINIDITEDMEDGSAEGEFELDGTTFTYSVDSEGNITIFYGENED